MRKLMDSDKVILVGKEKAVCSSKAKEGIHSQLPISRRIDVQPLPRCHT